MKLLNFSASIDASKYVSAAGICSGIGLRVMDYDAGNASFSLVQSGGTTLATVNGVAVPNAATAQDADIAAAIYTAIQATDA